MQIRPPVVDNAETNTTMTCRASSRRRIRNNNSPKTVKSALQSLVVLRPTDIQGQKKEQLCKSRKQEDKSIILPIVLMNNIGQQSTSVHEKETANMLASGLRVAGFRINIVQS
jgi:hypothetical protein